MRSDKRSFAVLLSVFLTAGTFSYAAVPSTENSVPPLTKFKKSSFLQGEIPVSWSEYSNGFGYAAQSISDDVIGQGGGNEKYAHDVIFSFGPGPICFSDVPEERVDIFKITPELKELLTSKGRKAGVYADEKIGRLIFSTLTFSNVQEGGIQKEYFISSGQDQKSFDLIVQYPGPAAFKASAKHFLSTLTLS